MLKISQVTSTDFSFQIMLFGLGKWILKTWVDTRQLLLNAENNQGSRSHYQSTRRPRLGPRTIFGVVETPVAIEFARDSMRELMLTLQAVRWRIVFFNRSYQSPSSSRSLLSSKFLQHRSATPLFIAQASKPSSDLSRHSAAPSNSPINLSSSWVPSTQL